MVYLIHFDKDYKGVQHYLGYSADEKFDYRIEHHRKNRGACLMKAVNNAGINWEVVRTWPGMDGNFERLLKKRKNHSFLCPICKERKAQERRDKAKSKKQII